MAVAATGFFDGVHSGHRQVIGQLCSMASSYDQKSLIVTFWPHPRTVLQQDADSLRLLTTLEEKRRLCLDCGVDEVVIIPFTRAFSRLTAREFLMQYLAGQYGVTSLVLGYDHRLGCDMTGDPLQMEQTVRECGIEPLRVSRFGSVSSTSIRRLLSEGEVARANELLGYRYGLQGVVVSSGGKVGRSLGFPTANMQLYEPLKLLPSDGVYAVWVEVMGAIYKGVCNIGTCPTLNHNRGRSISVHIIDFDDVIYGLDIKIEFVSRIRDEMEFDSIDSLKCRMETDRKTVTDSMMLTEDILLR